MIKKISLIMLLSWVIALWWCNINGKDAKSDNTNNKVSTWATASTNKLINIDKITLYIDKNCETAWIQQCNPSLWKQQFWQILWASWLAINYFNEANTNAIKSIVPTSPVLVIPSDKLSKFWPQAQGIKQQAKNVNWNYYLPLYSWIPAEENLCNDGKDNNNDGKIDAKDPTCFSMTVLTSSSCKEQYCNETVLKNMLMWYNLKFVDYNTKEWKDLYNKLPAWQKLPTFLYNKDKKYMENMKQFIKDTNVDGYTKQLNIPSFKYDPSIEACATDCNASPVCKQKLLSCNKKDIPNVDVYVMSYCPFGTQAEKWLIPVVNLLWKKINFKVKFVDYAMHGKKEIDENTNQYCIEKEQNDKYIKYLTCFLEKWDNKNCFKTTNIDTDKLNKCVKETDKKYNITWLFNDKSTWLNGQYPQYNIHKDENKKYGVQGSPTLVINWIKVQPSSRSPQSYLDTICKAFKNKPAECNKKLSNNAYDPMWGWTQNGKAAPAGSCGK